MTLYNKSTLATFFAQGDVPQGTDYANLINSQVNLVETVIQQMAGPLGTTELDTPLVSAATVNATTMLTATAINIAGTVSAAAFNGVTGTFTNANVTTVSAATVNAGVYRTSTPVIVSAAGTAQATASPISSSVGITRLQGVTDGQATGFLLPSPTGNIGVEQTLVCEAAVSCNLWPSIGCKINGLGSNAAFALAANTPYYVTYTQASAYAVK
jgi:hypothetical protein